MKLSEKLNEIAVEQSNTALLCHIKHIEALEKQVRDQNPKRFFTYKDSGSNRGFNLDKISDFSCLEVDTYFSVFFQGNEHYYIRIDKSEYPRFIKALQSWGVDSPESSEK